MIWILVIGILVSWILLSKVRIELIYQREQELDEGEIAFFLLHGLIRFRYRFPEINWTGIDEGLEVKEESPIQSKRIKINLQTVQQFVDRYRELLDNIYFLKRTIQQFIRHITCHELQWKTKIGTGDAAEVGVLFGIVWGVKMNLVGMLHRHIQWEQDPQVEVIPDFYQSILFTDCQGIFSFRMGHAIRIMIQLLLHLWKGRKRNWQENIPFKA